MTHLRRTATRLVFAALFLIGTSSPALAATVETDKSDYAPGEHVLITGSDWLPGETVELVIVEEPMLYEPDVYYAVADGLGTIYNEEHLVEEHDLGRTFYVTATGQTSGYMAGTTFTDGNIKVEPSPGTILFAMTWATYATTNCSGASTDSGTTNVGTSGASQFSKGVGNAESISLQAAAAANAPSTLGFTSWSSTSAFSALAQPRAICITGFNSGSRTYFANYNCGDGDTDTDEQCDPASSSNTACCSSTCTFKAQATTCRGQNGACDVAETCSGSDAACPVDGFVTSGIECRGVAEGDDCDVPEACTGSGPDCPVDAVAPSATTCREAAGNCDVAETCDGLAKSCPANDLVDAGTTCRAADGACDVAEACDGSSALCPADAVVLAGNTCREATGACDLAEACNGSDKACPADAVASGGTTCRDASGKCDVAESCDGTTKACPTDAVAASGATCRAVQGACDVAEKCDGAASTCPTDAFAGAETECRAANGACDVAEACSGSGPACPADAFVESGTECRVAVGDCDVAESCTGTGAACPEDVLVAAGNECRGADGDCDVAEACTGTSADCPEDGFADSGTECRLATSECDATETCDGTSGDCPADLPAPCSVVTSSSLCQFDVDDGTTGRQFRLIYTPDQGSQSIFKLNASNPGQYYYNVVYVGPGDETVTLTIPYPFVTQGATPIHVYSDLASSELDGDICFGPGTEIQNDKTQITLASYGSNPTFASTTDVEIVLPPLLSGAAYINIHLDYGLKGTANYKNVSLNAADATTSVVKIPNLEEYTFVDTVESAATGETGGGDAVQSLNAFKKNPGIGGLVTHAGSADPVAGVQVQIFDSKNVKVGDLKTDEDGWYMWQYKYTGKATTFTVKSSGQSQSVTMKSNSFAAVNFTLP